MFVIKGALQSTVLDIKLLGYQAIDYLSAIFVSEYGVLIGETVWRDLASAPSTHSTDHTALITAAMRAAFAFSHTTELWGCHLAKWLSPSEPLFVNLACVEGLERTLKRHSDALLSCSDASSSVGPAGIKSVLEAIALCKEDLRTLYHGCIRQILKSSSHASLSEEDVTTITTRRDIVNSAENVISIFQKCAESCRVDGIDALAL
jgi:hypothetical protein